MNHHQITMTSHFCLHRIFVHAQTDAKKKKHQLPKRSENIPKQTIPILHAIARGFSPPEKN